MTATSVSGSRASAAAIPAGMLAPVWFVATAVPFARSASASRRVVVVLPFVAETSATRRAPTTSASRSGSMPSMTRPLTWVPAPRPVTRDAHPAARPAVSASRARGVVTAARTSRHRRGTGSRSAPGRRRAGACRARGGSRRCTCSCSAGGSTAMWLTERKRSSDLVAGEHLLVVERGFGQRAEVGVLDERRVAPLVVLAPRRPLLDPVHDRPQLVDEVVAAVTRVPDEPEPAAGAQHPRELGRARPGASNQWKRLGDGDRVERSGRERGAARRSTATIGHARAHRDERRRASRPPARRATSVGAESGVSSRVSLPVPAATSATRAPGTDPQVLDEPRHRVGWVASGGPARRPRRPGRTRWRRPRGPASAS